MVYARRRTCFRSIRGRRRYRPTAYRPKKMSWWRRKRTRFQRKRWFNPNTAKSQLLKLKFADTYTLDCGGSALATRDFRLNSIYDPDATGVGGSPSAMVQYAQLYRSYKVVAAKVTARVWNSGTVPAVFGLTCQSDEYSLPGTGALLQQLTFENGSAKFCITQPSTYGDRNMGFVKWFGRIKPLLGERYIGGDAAATIGSNPAKIAHCYAYCIAPDGDAVGAKVTAVMTFTYYVKLFNQNSANIAD